MDLSNPMLPFNAPTDQAFALQQMLSLLGGLGGQPTANAPIAPNMGQKQPQPAAGMQSLLGGLGDPFQQNPMQKNRLG